MQLSDVSDDQSYLSATSRNFHFLSMTIETSPLLKHNISAFRRLLRKWYQSLKKNVKANPINSFWELRQNVLHQQGRILALDVSWRNRISELEYIVLTTRFLDSIEVIFFARNNRTYKICIHHTTCYIFRIWLTTFHDQIL